MLPEIIDFTQLKYGDIAMIWLVVVKTHWMMIEWLLHDDRLITLW
jgi:hypothetical protein